jgi:hypothetical protein
MRKLPLANVTQVCWSQRCFARQAPPRGPARLALLNLGIEGLLVAGSFG